MPEGDTVFLAATRLRRALADQVLIATDFRVPRDALADLSGMTVTHVIPRGKHLFIRTDGGYSVHAHFKLDGSFQLYRPERRFGPMEDVRLILRTDPWTAVGFLLGVCEVIKTEDEEAVVAHLGPDPLGPDWDLDEAERRMRAHPEREIGDVLLDQTVVAGWGNAYKNEIMFLRGLDPWTTVGQIEDLRGMIALGRKMLLANRMTGRWVTTGNLRYGEGQYVMERAGKPCRRCGTTILRTKQNGDGYMRWTYWCPSCQGTSRPGTVRPIRAPRRV